MAAVPVNNVEPFHQYSASAGQATFTYAAAAYTANDWLVYVNGTLKTVSSDYSITGVGTTSGGNIIFATPMTGGEIVTFFRKIAQERLTGYSPSGTLSESALSTEQSREISIMQDLALQASRSIRVQNFDSNGTLILPAASVRANNLLSFDSVGNVTVTNPTTIVPGTPPTVNINTLKKIRVEDFSGYFGDFNDQIYTGQSDHVAWAAVLNAMLAEPTAVFDGSENRKKVIFLNSNIGAFRAPPNAKFYWDGTKVFGDTRPGGVYNTGGLLTFNAPMQMYHRDLILNGSAQHPITSITVSGTTATVTTVDAHGYVAGQFTGMWGVERPNGSLTSQEAILAASGFNGLKVVTGVPTALSYTYTVAAGTPTNPIVTRGRACWTKNILFGGDGIRVFNGADMTLENCRFESINDAYVRYTGTTNDAAIIATPTLPVAAFNLRMLNCHSINCTQGSSTSGGAQTVIIDNHIAELSRASAWKMASRTGTGFNAGGLLHFDGIVKDSIPAASPDFNAAHPNCYSQVGIVAEGVQDLRVRGTFKRVREAGNFLPNRDDSSTLPTKNLCRNIDIDIQIIDGGDPLNKRMWDGLRIEESESQTNLAEGNKNSRLRVQCYGLNGHAVRVGGSNLGYNSGMDYDVFAQDCAGSLALRTRNGGSGRIKCFSDGAAAVTTNLWVTNTVTYKVSEHAIFGDLFGKTKWRCDVSPGTPSTIAPTGSGSVVTADGYTWKSLYRSEALVVDADESQALMQDMTIDAITIKNPLGGGVYLSKLNSATYRVIATENQGVGLTESNLTYSVAELVKAHRNTATQINSTGMVNHNYSVIDYDCNNNTYAPHSIDNYNDIVLNQRTIRRANSTGNLNLNAIRMDGVTINGAPIMIDCTTVQDVVNTNAYGFKHLLDKCHFDTTVSGIADIGSAGGTTGLFPGGSQLRLGTYSTTRQKGGASAGSMTHDVSIGGFYTASTNLYNTVAPPVATRLIGNSNFTGSCGWAGANNTVVGSPAVWHVVNFGEGGATGNLTTEPPADSFGIVDGGTINTNCHWWLVGNTYNDYGSVTSPVWLTGTLYQPGNFRASGVVISSLTGNGTTATAISAAHGLLTGRVMYLSRGNGLFTGYNGSSFNRVTITVVDVNTFTFPCAGTGTAAPSSGNTDIVMLDGMYEMVAPNARTSGATRPVGRGIAAGNYFLAFAGAGFKSVAV